MARNKTAAMAAYAGVMSALSVCIMLTGGVIPIATYVSPMLASLLLYPLRREFGRPCAWTAWGAVALLTLLLGLDREAAFFYIFVGFWPIVREDVEAHVPPGPVRTAAKTVIFALLVGAMYAFLCFVLRLDAVVSEFGEMGMALTAAFMVLMCVCLLLYDRLLGILSVWYVKKLRPKLPMLR